MSKSRENRNAVAIAKLRCEMREWKKRVDNPSLRLNEVVQPLYRALEEFYRETTDLAPAEAT